MNLCQNSEDSKQLPPSLGHWGSVGVKGYAARPLPLKNHMHISGHVARSSSCSSPVRTVGDELKMWEQSSPGHLGTMRTMRRSFPSQSDVSWSTGGYDHAEISWKSPRNERRDIRIRSSRHPADYGANLGHSSRHRGHSSSATSRVTAAAEDMSSAAVLQDLKSQPERCSSLPPASLATPRVDDAASTLAKAKAVAALQKLFFEEMAKGGQDPSGAAARALRRLNDAGQEDVVISSSSCCKPAMHVESGTSDDIAQDHRPMVPQVPPPPGANGRRRPRPQTFFPVN